MAERKRRHRWVQNPAAPTRDDMRVCAHPDCGMLRNDYGPLRYEFRTPAWKFIVNQKKTWPMPPCVPPSTQKDTAR